MKNSILFYISGHGFGHATREVEVINALLHLNPEVHAIIKTDAPEWFFRLNLPSRRFTLISEKVDVGLVQENSFTADRRKTLETFAKFYLNFKNRLPRELEFLQKNGIKAIVGDIPPLAFEVSQRAGLPGIAIANFSWDWIYEPYIEEFPEFAWVVPTLKMLYGKADALLRLPLHGDLSAFPNPKDIPLIARKAKSPREAVRAKFDFLEDPQNAKIGLISLRTNDLEKINLAHLAKINNVHFLTFSAESFVPNVHTLPPDFLPYQELVHAADVVISKPGYGIVSECIANRTPLLFTSRDDFREFEVLAKGILELGLGLFLPREQFFAGDWKEALDRLPDLKSNWKQPPVNGADEAARFILSSPEGKL